MLVAVAAVTLSGFPDFVHHAQNWITHLGNVAAPLTGVVLADYLVRKRQRIDVQALFDPDGRYRYLNGVNVEAILAVAGAVAVYYALSEDAWLPSPGVRKRGRQIPPPALVALAFLARLPTRSCDLRHFYQ